MRALLASLVILVLAPEAQAQEGPPQERLVDAVAALIPSYWLVRDLRVVTSANLGDPVEPKIKQRLEAKVAPRADLFVEDAAARASFEPFTPLLPTMSTGAERTLHGIANSTYAAGEWTVDLRLENDVAGLGQPVDLFAGPTVVRGSEEETRLGERLRSGMIGKLREQLTAEREQIAAELRQEVKQLQAQQAAELARLHEEQATTLKREGEELARARSAFAAQLDAAKREREMVLASLQQEHDTRRAALAQQQQVALKQLKAEHEAELNRIEARYAQELARAEAEVKGRTALIEAERRKQEELARLAEARQATADREMALVQEAQRAQQRASDEAAREKAQRIDNILSAMQGKDGAVALAAFEAAITGEDQALRDAAFGAALSSPHAGIRHRALRQHFSSAGTIAGQLTGKWREEEFTGSFSLVIQKREESRGVLNFAGLLRSPLFGREGCSPVQGTLDGDVVSVSGKICSLTLRLSNDQSFEGSLHHEKVDTPRGCCPGLNMRAVALVR